ncbi:MAG: XdhC family protein [Sphaerochaeta sp.]
MNLFETAALYAKYNRSFSIATIIGTSGHTPRKDGRMLILPDGTFSGTVGGGSAERKVIDLANKAMEEGRGKRVQVNVRECGMIDVYIDVPVRGRKAIIFGTGHIAKALSEVLYKIGFQITFIDDFAAKNGFTCPDGMELGTSEKLLKRNIKPDKKTAVIFSNPEDRDTFIDLILNSEAPYIGVLSSKSREKINNSRVYQPIGLDIGAETPEEIAISITAQILAVMNGKEF